MYERLLVAIDGSDVAESIIPYALGISRATGVPLTLVRIDDDGRYGEALAHVDALAARLGADARCINSEGDVASALLKEAARVPGTLVAMTTHGRSGVLGVVLGSIAMQVLRGGQQPVLLYRPHERFTGQPGDPIRITTVVVPMDGTPAAESIGMQAAQWAHWIGARLIVISVLAPAARAAADAPSGDLLESSYVRSRANELGKQHGVEVSWETLHGRHADQAIADYIGDDRGTMLAMVTRAHAEPLSAALLGSITTGCLRKAGVPILMRLP